MFPANRINRPPDWNDYMEAARRMVAAGMDVETSSLEECQQVVADVQAARDRDLVDEDPHVETPNARLVLSN